MNDAAFLTRADHVWTLANVMRTWNTPNRVFREWAAIVGMQNQFNYDRDRTSAQLHAFAGGQLANYWNVAFYTEIYPDVSDDRLTRGGALVRRGGGRLLHARFSTDSRRRVTLSSSYDNVTDTDGGYHHGVNASIGFRPAPNIQLSLGPGFSTSRDTRQFVLRRGDATAAHFFGERVVVADIDQNTFSMSTRLNWTFTPRLSLQLFAQPFVFAGDYSRFKEFTGPRTRETMVYGVDFGSVCLVGNRYTLDPAGDCAAEPSARAFSFSNPDLNVRSLRGNAVLRWEYRPGSTLFFVWQQQRAGFEPFGDFDFSRDAGAVFRERADNIFVIKASYWIGR